MRGDPWRTRGAHTCEDKCPFPLFSLHLPFFFLDTTVASFSTTTFRSPRDNIPPFSICHRVTLPCAFSFLVLRWSKGRATLGR